MSESIKQADTTVRYPLNHGARRPTATIPQAIEQKWFERWAQNPDLYTRRAVRPHCAQEVLRAGDAAVPLGRAAHGTRAQLRHRRRPGALHVDAGLQRAAPHGLGLVRSAGRERRYRQPDAAARVDAAQHRGHEAADEAARLRLRLVEGSHHLPARLLPLEPVVLPEVLRARPGLSQEEQGELVSEVRHRAGQRAGAVERLLLAP